MLIFDLANDQAFGRSVAQVLDTPLSAHELRRFDDGECKVRPLADPCGADAYVLHSLHGEAGDSPHDKLVRLLMFAACLREHGAARVTAVTPYLAYARKDRRTKAFDPNSLRYVAQLMEAAGIDQVMAVEVHNTAAFENAFRCTTVHVDSRLAFVDAAREWAAAGPLAVASPDPGGVKRAQLWQSELEAQLGRPVGFAFCDKRRSSGLIGGTDLVAGEVQGMAVLLVDDLIVSGRTLQRAAVALRHAGATTVVACAAHALFSPEAWITLQDGAVAQIVVSDTVPLPAHGAAGRTADWHGRIRVASCVPLLAAAIRRSHEGWRR